VGAEAGDSDERPIGEQHDASAQEQPQEKSAARVSETTSGERAAANVSLPTEPSELALGNNLAGEQSRQLSPDGQWSSEEPEVAESKRESACESEWPRVAEAKLGATGGSSALSSAPSSAKWASGESAEFAASLEQARRPETMGGGSRVAAEKQTSVVGSSSTAERSLSSLEAKEKLRATVQQLHYNKSLALGGGSSREQPASGQLGGEPAPYFRPPTSHWNESQEASLLASEDEWRQRAQAGGSSPSLAPALGTQQLHAAVAALPVERQQRGWADGAPFLDPLETAAAGEQLGLQKNVENTGSGGAPKSGPLEIPLEEEPQAPARAPSEQRQRQQSAAWGRRKSAADGARAAATQAEATQQEAGGQTRAYEDLVTWTPAAGPAAYRAGVGFQPAGTALQQVAASEPASRADSRRKWAEQAGGGWARAEQSGRNGEFFAPAHEYVRPIAVGSPPAARRAAGRRRQIARVARPAAEAAAEASDRQEQSGERQPAASETSERLVDAREDQDEPEEQEEPDEEPAEEAPTTSTTSSPRPPPRPQAGNRKRQRARKPAGARSHATRRPTSSGASKGVDGAQKQTDSVQKQTDSEPAQRDVEAPEERPREEQVPRDEARKWRETKPATGWRRQRAEAAAKREPDRKEQAQEASPEGAPKWSQADTSAAGEPGGREGAGPVGQRVVSPVIKTVRLVESEEPAMKTATSWPSETGAQSTSVTQQRHHSGSPASVSIETFPREVGVAQAGWSPASHAFVPVRSPQVGVPAGDARHSHQTRSLAGELATRETSAGTVASQTQFGRPLDTPNAMELRPAELSFRQTSARKQEGGEGPQARLVGASLNVQRAPADALPAAGGERNWSIVVLPYPRPSPQAANYFSLLGAGERRPLELASLASGSSALSEPGRKFPGQPLGVGQQAMYANYLQPSNSIQEAAFRQTNNFQTSNFQEPTLQASSLVESGNFAAANNWPEGSSFQRSNNNIQQLGDKLDTLTISLRTRPLAAGPNQLFWEAAAREAAAPLQRHRRIPLTNGHLPLQHREPPADYLASGSAAVQQRLEQPSLRRPLSLAASQEPAGSALATAGNAAHTNGHAYAGSSALERPRGHLGGGASGLFSFASREHEQAFGSAELAPYWHSFAQVAALAQAQGHEVGSPLAMMAARPVSVFASPELTTKQQQAASSESQFVKKGSSSGALISATLPLASPHRLADPYGWPASHGSAATKALLRINHVAPPPSYLIPPADRKPGGVSSAAAAPSQPVTVSGQSSVQQELPAASGWTPSVSGLAGAHSMLRPSSVFAPPQTSPRPAAANVIRLQLSTRAPTPAPSRRERLWKRLQQFRARSLASLAGGSAANRSALARVSWGSTSSSAADWQLDGAPAESLSPALNEPHSSALFDGAPLAADEPAAGQETLRRFRRGLGHLVPRPVRLLAHRLRPSGQPSNSTAGKTRPSDQGPAPAHHDVGVAPLPPLALMSQESALSDLYAGGQATVVPILDSQHLLEQLESEALGQALLHDARHSPWSNGGQSSGTHGHAPAPTGLNTEGSMRVVSHALPNPQTSSGSSFVSAGQQEALQTSGPMVDPLRELGQRQQLEPPANQPGSLQPQEGGASPSGGNGRARDRFKQLSSSLIRSSRRPLDKLLQFSNFTGRLMASPSAASSLVSIKHATPSGQSQKTAASSPAGALRASGTGLSLAQQFNSFVSPAVMLSSPGRPSSVENFNRFAEPLADWLAHNKQNAMGATPLPGSQQTSGKPTSPLLPLASHLSQAASPYSFVVAHRPLVEPLFPFHDRRQPFSSNQWTQLLPQTQPLAAQNPHQQTNHLPLPLALPPSAWSQTGGQPWQRNESRPAAEPRLQERVWSTPAGEQARLVQQRLGLANWLRRAGRDESPTGELPAGGGRPQLHFQGQKARLMRPQSRPMESTILLDDEGRPHAQQQAAHAQLRASGHSQQQPSLPLGRVLQLTTKPSFRFVSPRQQQQYAAPLGQLSYSQAPTGRAMGRQRLQEPRGAPLKPGVEFFQERPPMVGRNGSHLGATGHTTVTYSDAEVLAASSDQQAMELQAGGEQGRFEGAAFEGAPGELNSLLAPADEELGLAQEQHSVDQAGHQLNQANQNQQQQQLQVHQQQQQQQQQQQAEQSLAGDALQTDFQNGAQMQQQQFASVHQTVLSPSRAHQQHTFVHAPGQQQQQQLVHQFASLPVGAQPAQHHGETVYVPVGAEAQLVPTMSALPAAQLQRPRLAKFLIPSINTLTSRFRQHLMQAFRLNPMASSVVAQQQVLQQPSTGQQWFQLHEQPGQMVSHQPTFVGQTMFRQQQVAAGGQAGSPLASGMVQRQPKQQATVYYEAAVQQQQPQQHQLQVQVQPDYSGQAASFGQQQASILHQQQQQQQQQQQAQQPEAEFKFDQNGQLVQTVSAAQPQTGAGRLFKKEPQLQQTLQHSTQLQGPHTEGLANSTGVETIELAEEQVQTSDGASNELASGQPLVEAEQLFAAPPPSQHNGTTSYRVQQKARPSSAGPHNLMTDFGATLLASDGSMIPEDQLEAQPKRVPPQQQHQQQQQLQLQHQQMSSKDHFVRDQATQNLAEDSQIIRIVSAVGQLNGSEAELHEVRAQEQVEELLGGGQPGGNSSGGLASEQEVAKNSLGSFATASDSDDSETAGVLAAPPQTSAPANRQQSANQTSGVAAYQPEAPLYVKVQQGGRARGRTYSDFERAVVANETAAPPSQQQPQTVSFRGAKVRPVFRKNQYGTRTAATPTQVSVGVAAVSGGPSGPAGQRSRQAAVARQTDSPADYQVIRASAVELGGSGSGGAASASSQEAEIVQLSNGTVFSAARELSSGGGSNNSKRLGHNLTSLVEQSGEAESPPIEQQTLLGTTSGQHLDHFDASSVSAQLGGSTERQQQLSVGQNQVYEPSGNSLDEEAARDSLEPQEPLQQQQPQAQPPAASQRHYYVELAAPNGSSARPFRLGAAHSNLLANGLEYDFRPVTAASGAARPPNDSSLLLQTGLFSAPKQVEQVQQVSQQQDLLLVDQPVVLASPTSPSPQPVSSAAAAAPSSSSSSSQSSSQGSSTGASPLSEPPAVYVSLKPEQVVRLAAGPSSQASITANRKRPLKLPKRAQQHKAPETVSSMNSASSASSSASNNSPPTSAGGDQRASESAAVDQRQPPESSPVSAGGRAASSSSQAEAEVAPSGSSGASSTTSTTTARPRTSAGSAAVAASTSGGQAERVAESVEGSLRNHNLKSPTEAAESSALRDSATRAPKARIRWQGAAGSASLASAPASTVADAAGGAPATGSRTSGEAETRQAWLVGGMTHQAYSRQPSATPSPKQRHSPTTKSPSQEVSLEPNSTSTSVESAPLVPPSGQPVESAADPKGRPEGRPSNVTTAEATSRPTRLASFQHATGGQQLPSNHRAALDADHELQRVATGRPTSRESRTAPTSFRLAPATSAGAAEGSRDETLAGEQSAASETSAATVEPSNQAAHQEPPTGPSESSAAQTGGQTGSPTSVSVSSSGEELTSSSTGGPAGELPGGAAQVSKDEQKEASNSSAAASGQLETAPRQEDQSAPAETHRRRGGPEPSEQLAALDGLSDRGADLVAARASQPGGRPEQRGGGGSGDALDTLLGGAGTLRHSDD